MRFIEFFVAVAIMVCFGYGIYSYGVNAQNEPTNDYFWIDNNRYSKDSTVTVQVNLDENNDVFYCIIVESEIGTQYIQCFSDNVGSAEDWRDSFIMAFKEATGEDVN